METETADSNMMYPMIYIPKNCTNLQAECDMRDNIFIKLNITSLDTVGNEMTVYSGICNVKLIDSYEVHEVDAMQSESYEKISPMNATEASQLPNSSYNQSQVWIDPARSPYVYNNYDGMESQEHYSVYNSNAHITLEQHNTYITHNVYNYKEPMEFADQFEHKIFRTMHVAEMNHTVDQLYNNDGFEYDMHPSQFSEDSEKEKISSPDNSALKQLMSSDIQSLSKQQRTILYLGNDSQYGQTIQNIAINDPSVKCVDNVEEEGVENENSQINKKKYQCDKCKQIFYQLSTFKQHVVSGHKKKTSIYDLDLISNMQYSCIECGKNFKNQEKFDLHCMGHGDPDVECNKCRKVFASKFTLRNHLKIHNRKYSCMKCTKTYSSAEILRTHMAKIHFKFICKQCKFRTNSYLDWDLHRDIHKVNASDTKSAVSVASSSAATEEPMSDGDELLRKREQIRQADSVIAKVINNKIFLLHSKKARRHRKYNKKCDVCQKKFDRVGDLKRHLIEHVIRSTLTKTPVNKNGTLTIKCGVCQKDTFTKVDKYKAHLREHAKLTIYKCTFCDKSFSDSSNFSKHKKIHGTTFFQCDLCQRKFNSKKMITQHMEHHKNNSPLPCFHCNKEFHFESMLNKHVKSAHVREVSKFRCRFCHEYFRSLKEKWDHEWKIHNVRKIIVDCLICGAKFRKYSELKRHCSNVHNVEIPLAKRLYKKKL